eukprot:Phypoly_transcript_10642.p1 GENE.Phypoly_transcript_10642~~Phypoly_transcript_10642.p1  ORF type:complete len:332 (+),score=42.42 Phypoly_transcript_10642:214-1209(+)
MHHPAPLPTSWKKDNNKEDVMATNDDAAVSKLSAVKLGYFKDDFVHLFVRRPVKRPPLINRGYASRVLALEILIKQFLSTQPSVEKQIVSFGSGFDTTYWKLKSAGLNVKGYFEADFPAVVRGKINIITKNNSLFEPLQQFTKSDTELNGPDYHLFAADLNNIPNLESSLVKAGIDFSLPTLFLSECVMIYMAPEKGNDLIKWVGSKFSTGCFIVYEQILPHDPFGTMMVQNLENKGCGLLSIHQYPDIETQRKRYTEGGWDKAEVLDMNNVYDFFLPKTEVVRIARVEIFDEVEEWKLIQGHYCITIAFRDVPGGHFWDGFNFEASKSAR